VKKTISLFITFLLLTITIQKGIAQELSLAHYVTAKELFKIDSLNLALIELDSAIKIAPKFAKSYALKGKIWELKNEQRKAIGQYSLAILHNPNNIEFYLKRAALHFKLKDHRDYVLNDINEAIRLKPSNGDFQELKAYYYAHTLNPKSLKPDFKNAIIAMNKAIEIDNNVARYYMNRSNYKLKNEQKLSSLLDINKAIELDSNNASFFYQRALIKYIMGDFRISLNDINRTIELENQSIDYFQLRGNVYFNLKRYDAAYKDYSVAINLIFSQIAQSKSKISSKSQLNLKLRQTLLLRGMSLVHGNKPYDGCDDFNRALKMGESKASNYIKQYCN